MGVRGFTTWTESYKAAISEVKEFSVESPTAGAPSSSTSTSSAEATTTLAVDAWAWIYRLWLGNFGQSVQGGNYKDVADLVKDTVAAWR